MSQRDKEKAKKTSLDALAKFAYAVGGGNPAPAKPAAQPASSLPKPAPKVAPVPKPEPPRTPVQADAARARRIQAEDRKAKMEEERSLKKRREAELARGSTSEWRGMWTGGSMPGVRRTAFERNEPSLADKIHGVLGDTAEKEGRAKNRDKGKRTGGK